MSDDAPTMYEPATAAEKLGMSASGLRRLGPIYEAVHGELPRTGKGAEDKRPRLWPAEAVERLTTARALVVAKRYETIEKALEALRDGIELDGEGLAIEAPQRGSELATQHALRVLLEEVQGLRGEVVALQRQVSELRALPPVGESGPVKVVEPQRTEQAKWAEGVSTDEALGVRKFRDDGVLVRWARQLERFLGRN